MTRNRSSPARSAARPGSRHCCCPAGCAAIRHPRRAWAPPERGAAWPAGRAAGWRAASGSRDRRWGLRGGSRGSGWCDRRCRRCGRRCCRRGRGLRCGRGRRQQAEGAVADRSADPQLVAGPGTGAGQAPPLRHPAERRDRDGERSRRDHRVAAAQHDAVAPLVGRQPAREARDPRLAPVLRQRQRQLVGERRGTTRRKVGQADAQRLRGDPRRQPMGLAAFEAAVREVSR